MNKAIAKELETLWSGIEENDIEQKLEAFARLKAKATKDDLPHLLDALKSNRNNFWTRELLSEPISELGGSKYLAELFDALQKNHDEGHDNDSFNHFLMEIALAEPEACKEKLNTLLANDNFQHREAAEWLLEFCE